MTVALDSKEVNKIQVFEPKEVELEKDGREPNDKSIEGLKISKLMRRDSSCLDKRYPNKKMKIWLSSSWRIRRCFAWTPKEMLGIDLEVMVHRLNVDPAHKPVVQKVKRSSPAHADVVVEEVERLVEAGAIREV